ncbi:MAG: hypothetical protein QM756_18810 [Polyangiaceae bacterium]
MRIGRIVGLGGALLLVSALFSGCQKKAGDSCNGAQVRCLDKVRALECIQGTFAEVQCLGPNGCVDVAKMCDRTKAAAGDACDGEWAACSKDGKQFLECKSSKLSVTAICGGPRGCYSFGARELRCDTSKSNVGDMCTEKNVSCSMDGKEMLRCQDAKFAPDAPCRGPQGCRESADKINCDQTLGQAGDKCEGSGAACDVSGKNLLECKGDKLSQSKVCRGQEGCKVIGTQVRCDESRGLPGDPCESGSAACAVDGSSLLSCKGGKLAVSRACKKPCEVHGSLVDCG